MSKNSSNSANIYLLQKNLKAFLIVFLIPAIVIVGLFELFKHLPQSQDSIAASSSQNASPNNLQSAKSLAASSTPKNALPAKVLLAVPYAAEAPGNYWTGPWKNACEEASMTMVDKYYAGVATTSVSEAKQFMETLFAAEDKIYGSNVNESAEESAYIINNYSDFKGTIVTDPTIEQIKEQLNEGHPVIAFHDGFDLNNPDIPFLPNGSAYHSTVIAGYDDGKNSFIVNDPGDETDGVNHYYDYNTYMSSLHDYDYSDNQADGPARVIFTSK